jgi:hypothetical protein
MWNLIDLNHKIICFNKFKFIFFSLHLKINMRINFVGWKINIRLISIKNNTTYVEMICIKAKKVASPKWLCYHYHAHGIYTYIDKHTSHSNCISNSTNINLKNNVNICKTHLPHRILWPIMLFRNRCEVNTWDMPLQ